VTTRKLLTHIGFNNAAVTRLGNWLFWSAIFVATLATGSNAYAAPTCDQTITANVVVFDNPTVFNRLGAQNPNWITYSLRRDAIFMNRGNPTDSDNGKPLTQVNKPMAELVGNVERRPDKRPRPLVIRSVAGACLTVNFQNLLDPIANPNPPGPGGLFNDDQVAGRCAGFHASGVELVDTIASDGSMVGNNYPGDDIAANCGIGDIKGSLAGPGASLTYKLYTPHEGAFIINSYGATLGSEASGGNTAVGMFGALNVEPKRSKIYRSQVTEEEMRLATTGTVASDCVTGQTVGIDCNPGGQPIIDYEALYPNVEPWISEGKAGLPIINMLTTSGELVHSDINAIIAGTNPDGSFTPDTYPLESVGKRNPQLPNRLEAFREFTSQFHDEQTNSEAFPRWYNDPVLEFTLSGVKDQFMINYGVGGIGSEIIANRLHTGPMHDCTNCAYEEFFLASSTVGDPALLVNTPANSLIEQCDPKAIAGPSCWRDPVNLANGPIPGNYALYQEDPSNVHHAYTGDFTKIRNTHAGSFEQHIFHLHNHQWLFNPNDDNANYLDAQEIMPGSGHTYELVNGGVGNRNKTAGDAIFHCHFYPHFAQGMWYHIRIMDVFEKGSVLSVSNADDPQKPTSGYHSGRWDLRSGKPAAGARALPDGELPDGVPIPAIVPLPGKAMPQLPAPVTVMAVDRGGHSLLGGRTPPDGIPDSSQVVVDRSVAFGADGIAGTPDDISPGYPFWLAGYECGPDVDIATGECPLGITGNRMPTPPLDMLTEAGATANGYAPGQAGGWDGGLPRHALLGYVAGGLSADTQSRLDFRKVIEMAAPVYYPETGTDLEKVSMAYQGSTRSRPSVKLDLAGNVSPAGFVQNGAPPVPGGPFNDPCVDDEGDRLTAGVVGDWFDGKGGLATKGASQYSSENPRTYKIANVQIDAVFNKVGYHYPQERIIALWEDVEPTINKQRPPEPLVMRFNTFDCGKLLHANLVPHEYELDDFQVRTPTDIIGQHIHLPKWDLTSNDGAANGWNYEDGALAPGIVQERIVAINHFNTYAGTVVPAGTLPGQLGPIDLSDRVAIPTIDTGDPGSAVPPGTKQLTALPHPFFGGIAGNPQTHLYDGARTVIQRILVDPVVNVKGVDRGLGLTFSHDHYGPSTFQQIGLYSTILAEPAGSTWYHNESGEALGTRQDGGPTTWQAAILPPDTAPNGSTVKSEAMKDHREFYFEMSDFQHAYEAGVYVGADANGIPVLTDILQPDIFNATEATAPALEQTWKQTVNPPLKLKSVPFPDIVTAEGQCPGPAADANGNPDPNVRTNASPFVSRPCVEAINISHSSTWVVNYRNEPIGLRVFDPNADGPDGRKGSQTDGLAGDLALALQSRKDRAIPELNTRFGNTPYPTASYCDNARGNKGDGINCDRKRGDPFTPIMRTYEFDEIKVKIQIGATEEQHQTTMHGLKWLSNGSGFGQSPNSGWRNFQSHGISEQFSLQTPIVPDRGQRGDVVDYMYATDATRPGMWLGTWGLLRSYAKRQRDLFELPDNPQRGSIRFKNDKNFKGVCPKYVMNKNGGVVDPPGPDTFIKLKVNRFQVVAVKANDVLPNKLNVKIPQLTDIDPQFPTTTYGQQTVGGPLDPNGGTLVYNRRGTKVPTLTVVGEGGEIEKLRGGKGPLNDPTALMYVRLSDLKPRFIEGVSPDKNADLIDDRCQKRVQDDLDTDDDYSDDFDDEFEEDFQGDPLATVYKTKKGKKGCPLELKTNAPVEPLVLRANAGDCIEVVMHNKLLDQATVDYRAPGFDPRVFSCERKVNGKCKKQTMKPMYEADLAQKEVDNGKMLVTKDRAEITYADVRFDAMPDLAGWQDMMWGVNRDLGKPAAERPAEMHFFNNNLIRPSAWAGIHAQLVEFDTSVNDGVVTGGNLRTTIARPGKRHTYRYYAGDIKAKLVDEWVDPETGKTHRRFKRIPTPVEFGGSNLLSTDRIKQPQKGLFGALVIEPAAATYPDKISELELVPDGQARNSNTRKTRAQVTVTSPDGAAGSGGTYREALAIGHKITNLRWKNGTAIANIHQGELGREGAEDSGHAGFNYGMEPSWFRYKLPPDASFGNAGTPNSFGAIPNVHAFYANGLTLAEPNAIPAIPGVSEAGDPATPVFRTTANMASRIHVLNGASADRDGTWILHGHVWQRDPYVCPNDSYLGLPGFCKTKSVGAQALGLNPIGKYMGGEEGMGHVYGHWPILFNAGGSFGVPGDYLYRDYAPGGDRNGQFGILRVQPQ